MRARQKRSRFGTALIFLGVVAIIAAAGVWMYNELENRRVQQFSEQKTQQLLEIISLGGHNGDDEGNGDADVEPTPATPGGDAPDEDTLDESHNDDVQFVILDGEAYIGILRIPVLLLNLPVNNIWSYSRLKNSPCRYSGSVQEMDFVIAAHSYKTHFGRLNSLRIGDDVIFTDVEGNVHNFYVVAKEVIRPSETESVMDSPYDLTLFSCTYDSRSRVVVRCMMMVNNRN